MEDMSHRTILGGIAVGAASAALPQLAGERRARPRALPRTLDSPTTAQREYPAKVATGCCTGGGTQANHCAAVPTSFAADTVWKALDFQIDEETLFVYDYTGTATTFTAKATGDLDCDTTEIVYTLSGTATSGNSAVRVTEPAVNADWRSGTGAASSSPRPWR